MPAGQKPHLVLRRHFRAPVAKVFEAWTEGEALKRWFGPSHALAVVVAEVDVKVGGRWRIVMREQGGEQHRVGGTYREVVPNARLAFTWAWESTPERQSLVTVTLKAKDGGTDLTLLHEQFADEPTRDRHQHGWTGTLERLERHLAGEGV
jgi:uncharacterized protein YndB with AHSA1/START domain